MNCSVIADESICRIQYVAARESALEQTLGISIEQQEDWSLIRLDGEIEISCAAELKSVLLEAVGVRREIRVALGAASALDVTAAQLLWAGQRAAQQAGVKWMIVDGLAEPVAEVLAGAGLRELVAPTGAN